MTNRIKHYLMEIEKHARKLVELEEGFKGPKYRRQRKIHGDAIEGYTRRMTELGRVSPIVHVKGTTLQSFGKVQISKKVEIYFSNCIPEEVHLILGHTYKGFTLEDLEVIIPGETRILNTEQ